MNMDLLVKGLILGMAAGILPGPVMMFSLAQVIKANAWSGFLVQIGATLMDVARILIVFLVFSYFEFNETTAGLIALLGGIFLLYMAYGNFTYRLQAAESRSPVDNPILQGAIGNISNASAYIFWFTVGGPIILQANASGSKTGSLMFALGFLFAITVIGAIIAVLAGKVKVYLASIYYVYAIRLLGIILVIFSILFFKQAYQLLFP